MDPLTGIVLIICGIAAAANLIVRKQPRSKPMIDKLVPYQGWIGAIVCFFGIWTIIQALFAAELRSKRPLLWDTFLATGVMEFFLGFLLGYALITRYVLSRNAEALARGAQLRAKLVSIQIPLGLAGIALGIWCLIASFVFRA